MAGGSVITTSEEGDEVHPAALVTVKYQVPASISPKSRVVPLPLMLLVPGYR